jgi:hypothetical protein
VIPRISGHRRPGERRSPCDRRSEMAKKAKKKGKKKGGKKKGKK